MREVLKKYREIISYLFFGVLTTLVNWVSYFVLADILHVQYMASAFIAQLLSILFAYVTNRRWVFESKVSGAKALMAEMAKFFGARGVSLVLDMLFMYLGVDILRINDKAVKVVSSFFVIVANYIFSKLFVFRNAKAREEDQNG